jgi:hypothetical protein
VGELSLFPEEEPLSVEQAKKALFKAEAFEDGNLCPCCGQMVKLYHRRLRPEHAALLCWMHRRSPDDFLDVQGLAPRYALRSKDYSILAYWPLIEGSSEPEHTEERKRRTGWWRLTRLGREFVRGETKVPSSALVFNARCYGLSEDKVSVHDVLKGADFDYRELMGH